MLSLGLFSQAGDSLVLAQRREAKETLRELSALRETAPLRLYRTAPPAGQPSEAGRAILRLRQEVPAAAGERLLAAEMTNLESEDEPEAVGRSGR